VTEWVPVEAVPGVGVSMKLNVPEAPVGVKDEMITDPDPAEDEAPQDQLCPAPAPWITLNPAFDGVPGARLYVPPVGVEPFVTAILITVVPSSPPK
jgi:hypothetical protein